MTPEIDLSRGGYAVAALRFTMAAEAGIVICSLMNLTLYGRVAAGEHVSDEQLLAANGASGMVAVLGLVGLVFAAVTFIRWLVQARHNVDALGARGLEHSATWAVWGWFVPVLNLVRPYHVVEEVWRGSEPQPGRPFVTMGASTPPLLGQWWGAWIVSNVLGQIVFRMQAGLDEDAGIPAFILSERISVAASLVSIGAAWLAVRVIRGIDERQRARALRMAAEAEAARELVPA